MADIIQAAKWMDEGKRVIRANPFTPTAPHPRRGTPYVNFVPFCAVNGVVVSSVDPERKIPVFSTEALLATDWEVVEES